MHVVSQGGSRSGAGASGSGKRNFMTSGSSTSGSSSSASKKKKKNESTVNVLSGGKVEKLPNGGTIFRIGKRKFNIDGKDGKTLDDVIEVRNVENLKGFYNGK